MQCLILLLIAVLQALPGTATAAGHESQPAGTQGYRDELRRPPEEYKGVPRSGRQVYLYRCAGCHARATQGAPMPGDGIEWALRARQGMDVLMRHTLNGYRQQLMPPRGGCGNCSEAELRAAVMYMLEVSGVVPQEHKGE